MMSPTAQFVVVSCLFSLLIIKSNLGAPTVVERQRRQNFDFSMNTDSSQDNITGTSTPSISQNPDYDYIGGNNDYDTGSDCESVCNFQCLFNGECITTQCPNYTCPSQYDEYYDATTSTEGIDVTGGPSDGFLRCIHGNLTHFNCDCDEGWTGFACNLPCTLKCVHGTCTRRLEKIASEDQLTEEDMFCDCNHGYFDERCDKKFDSVDGEARARRTILITCLSVVAVTVIILPIVIFRNRLIIAMRTACIYKAKEFNDGKMYDAYISAGTSDKSLEFVKDLLVPKLKKKKFTLFAPCQHNMCEHVITDDIITAIRQSRWIIVVVTPEYLHNDWDKFERLCAQVEKTSLQEQLIPVILQDVSRDAVNVPKSLQPILESGNCLVVPGYESALPDHTQKQGSKKNMDKFWRCLQLIISKSREPISSYRNNCYVHTSLSDATCSK